jgi:hypothetical protein
MRFVRTLQRRVTPSGTDFYALSIPPQVAQSLGLQDGGQVIIEVIPVAKGKSEIVIRPGELHTKKRGMMK